jgi:tetrapyrrole methylase family protein/MazG family protein
MTAETRALLESGLPVILRTRHHPAVAEIDPRARFASCDDLYQSGGTFEGVYRAVVGRVLQAAEAGDVVYAVPGHPLVAEHTVAALLLEAAERGLTVRLYPALSFVDLAAVALGRDLGAVQLCDALDLRVDPARSALIGQVYGPDAASALKLKLLDAYPPEHPATLLHALGSPDEAVSVVPLSELDHRPFGYLDAVYLPGLAPFDNVRRFDGLYEIVRRLHAPGGCPWDREQTHASLRPHLLEEAYETLEAIDSGDLGRLTEELGDVLLQVVMHTGVAERLEEFTFADVTEHIARKIVRRHPHVFGEAVAPTAEDVRRSWEALKQEEKPRQSILEGVPGTLPALAASQALQGRARRVGFDWPDIEGPLDKLVEEVREFGHAANAWEREDEFGDILFVVANVAQRLGVDAEQALRRANEKFRRRFGRVEQLAASRGVDLRALDLAGLDELWDEAKADEAR